VLRERRKGKMMKRKKRCVETFFEIGSAAGARCRWVGKRPGMRTGKKINKTGTKIAGIAVNIIETKPGIRRMKALKRMDNEKNIERSEKR
jgi:hypothetical protein